MQRADILLAFLNMDQPAGNSADLMDGSSEQHFQDHQWLVPKNRGFEIKFAIPHDQIPQVLDFARRKLIPDPHVSRNSETYHVSSVYCDTPDWAVFRRQPGYRRSKYRIRRYQIEQIAFLEVKLRRGSRVAKRRVPVDLAEVQMLESPQADGSWPGGWFLKALQRRRLGPRLFVEYERAAYESTDDSPARLTLDTGLFCAAARDYDLHQQGTVPLLAGKAILELKYRKQVPDSFLSLVERLSLRPEAISKYRIGVLSAGLAEGRAPASEASLDGAGDVDRSGLAG